MGDPLLSVLAAVLKCGYLHPSIREKGGAYGAGATNDTSTNTFKFYSYRDPECMKTFNAFQNSINWAKNSITSQNLDEAILSGVTRLTIMDIARKEGIKLVERPFTVDEAKKSKEAFFTSSTSFLTPVVQIDDVIIGNGAPGLLTTKLLASYLRYLDSPKSNILIN